MLGGSLSAYCRALAAFPTEDVWDLLGYGVSLKAVVVLIPRNVTTSATLSAPVGMVVGVGLVVGMTLGTVGLGYSGRKLFVAMIGGAPLLAITGPAPAMTLRVEEGVGFVVRMPVGTAGLRRLWYGLLVGADDGMHSFTSTTAPSPIGQMADIGFVVHRVPAQAVCFRDGTAEDVRAMGNHLNMKRSNAASNSTQVVGFHAFGDGAYP